MAGVPAPVKRNPNATTAGGLTGVGVFVVWVLGYAHVSLSAEDATVLSGAITSGGLWFGRRGFCGLFRLLWRGDGQ